MTTLTRKSRLLIVCAALLSLVACDSGDSGKGSRGTLREGRPARDSGGGDLGGSSSEWPGGVIGAPQDDFYRSLKGFFSATADPEKYLGYVSGDASDDTGVLLDGSATLREGRLRTSGGNDSDIKSATIKILVKYAYLNDRDEEVIDGWYLDTLKFKSGEVRGNYIDIRFEDNYGTVTLEGEHDGEWFWGDFKYDNKTTWDGESGHYGTLGTFYFRLCEYFSCD